jgi:hypothetical protein
MIRCTKCGKAVGCLTIIDGRTELCYDCLPKIQSKNIPQQFEEELFNWKKAFATSEEREFKCDKCGGISKVNDKQDILQTGEHAYCIHCLKYIWIKMKNELNEVSGDEY